MANVTDRTRTMRPDSNSSHLAGEYFVAAELSKRRYSVALTMGNAKATRTVNVQVKAIRLRKNVGWPMWRAKVLDGVIYVFVCLNGNDRPPRYFIATSREVRPRVREYRTRGIINYGSLNSPRIKDRWDKIERGLRSAG